MSAQPEPPLCWPCLFRLAHHICEAPMTCPCDAEHIPIDTQQVAYDGSRHSAAEARVKWFQELLRVDPNGLLTDEFIRITGVHRTTASGEMSHMRQELLTRSIGTRLSDRGSPANVWALTDLGRTVANNLNGNGSAP